MVQQPSRCANKHMDAVAEILTLWPERRSLVQADTSQSYLSLERTLPNEPRSDTKVTKTFRSPGLSLDWQVSAVEALHNEAGCFAQKLKVIKDLSSKLARWRDSCAQRCFLAS